MDAYVVSCVPPLPRHWESRAIILAPPESGEPDQEIQQWVTNVYSVPDELSISDVIDMNQSHGIDKGVASNTLELAGAFQAKLPTEEQMRVIGFPDDEVAEIAKMRRHRDK